MISNYPAKYSDKNGEEVTTIHNDGKQLRIKIRNIEFIGDDFDSFEPIIDEDMSQLASFSFYPVRVLTRGDENNPDQSRDTQMLCNYLLECDIPVPVVVDTKVIQGTIHVHIIGEEKKQPHAVPGRGGELPGVTAKRELKATDPQSNMALACFFKQAAQCCLEKSR